MKDDSVSRAAVLNLIEQSCCDLEYDGDNVALRKEVEALPPAQPSVSKEEMVGDAVSRQGVLRLLNAVPSEEFATKAMLISGVNALPSAQPGWILCASETMPKMTDIYLVKVRINQHGEGMYPTYRTALWLTIYRKWFVHEKEDSIIGEVTAWMPIPWEGGQDGKN